MASRIMTFADYRELDAVNWSSLKHLRESPLKYRHMQDAPDEDTRYRALGRATHALVFEPQTFNADYAIYEGGDRRGKAWTEFAEAHAGQTIFKPNEIADAIGMANAVRVHPLIAPYLVDGEFEKSIQWTDPSTGQACKARLDWWARGKRALCDLKTSTTIDKFRFGRIAARLGYHCQLAHYYNGVCAQPEQVDEILLIAVESSAPYDVAVFVLDDDALFAGQEEVAELMRRLSEHRSSGVWPGRYTEKEPLLLPQWVFGDEDDEGALGGLKIGMEQE